MASIGNDSNGRKRILFVAQDGSRKTIRLGKATVKQAEAFKVKVEALVTAKITGSMDDEVARWVADRDDDIYARFAAVGLVPGRKNQRLREFLEGYANDRCDVKGGTLTVYGHTRRNLLDFFGDEKALRDITAGEADQWRLSLIGQGLSESTVRRRCGIAKQFFRAAVRQKLIPANPFADLKASGQVNTKKMYFVSHEEAQKVLDNCPDAQWRLLFALSRYAGLRCPSEHLALRWNDIDWQAGKMLVHSPKTEHHEGGESRMVPLFPELRGYLTEVFNARKGDNDFVITRYRQSNINLRTGLLRIIKRSGLKAWPKLFQNLRSTRETELAEEWPEHVVTKWIGHTSAVARKHYLQVTEDHFQRAAKRGTESGTQAAQNEAQHAAADTSTGEHKACVSEGIAETCKEMLAGALGLVGDKGFEPLTPCV